jgi:ribonuclease HI
MPRSVKIKKHFYAARVGRDGPAVYRDWNSCSAAVTGFPNDFKGFATKDEAFQFMRAGDVLRFPLFAPSTGPADVDRPKLQENVVLAYDAALAEQAVAVLAGEKRKRTEDAGEERSKKRSKAERHAEAKRKAQEDILRAASDARAIVAACDGAAAPTNPGPCSYGAFVLWPPRVAGGARNWTARAKFLGHGTNNIGELRAILRVLTLTEQWAARQAAQQPDVLPTKRMLYIFSDSDYSVHSVNGDWNGPDNRAVILEARDQARKLRKTCAIHMHLQWIPAHVGITCNELVDQLANEALTEENKTDSLAAKRPDVAHEDDIKRYGTGFDISATS